MAKSGASYVKPAKDNDGARRRWWKSLPETVATDLSTYCASLESAQQRDRYLGMVFEQLATGRAPQSYGIAMSGRVQGDMATALFSPPSENYCAIAVDVFSNKIGKNRPFLEWIPLAVSDYKTQAACRQATDYVEQLFNDLNTWPMVQQAFKDGCIHPGGYVRVGGSPGRVELTRVTNDEVLLDPTSGETPRNFQFRTFIARDAAIETYGTDEEKTTALQDTPGCYQGFYGLDVGYDDTLALCEGFYIPGNDKPGRHVVAINEVLLLDEVWNDDLPVAKFCYEPIAGSYKGQGCVEQMLPLQREVDRIADNNAEQERRFAWCKVQVRRADNIDPDSLTDNSIIEYNEKPALFEQGVAPTKELYNQLALKGQQCLLRVGISDAGAQGETPEGIDSGVAILANQQIDDVRHVAVSQRLEGFVEQLGKLIIQAAGRYKPEVYTNGKKIEWPQVASDQHLAKARAFPMSGLPQSIPGRKQALADMLRLGEIDKVTYRRAVGTNETRPASDAITASEDFAAYQLDKMIETGKFEPPIPFQDLQRSLTMAQARFMRESINDLDRSRLELIAQYCAMLTERMAEAPPPPAAPVDPMMPGPPMPGMPPGPPDPMASGLPGSAPMAPMPPAM